MQDQGRRLLIAVALALGVMFIWQSFIAEKEPVKKPAAVQTGSATGSGVPMVGTPIGVSTDPAAQPAAAPTKLGPEQEIKLSFPNVNATFSNHGGVLKSWHLTDSRYDREKATAGGNTKGELLPQLPGAGAFGVNFANSTYVLPAQTEWVGTKVSDREIVYTLKTDTLELEKRFVLVPEAYIIKATFSVKAKPAAGAEARQQLALSLYGFQNPKDDGGGGQSVAPRRWESSTYRNGEHLGTTVGSVIKLPRYEYSVAWTGFEHPYLLVGVAPKHAITNKQTIAQGADGLMRTDILFTPADTFRADSGVTTREVTAFLGPKHYNDLEHADDVAGVPTHFKDTIDLGWFGFIGKPLMWLLLKFYSFLQNWGLSIVLLTIVVKSLTIPFTTKSMRSMKAMAVLAPQMKGLQEKYKHDKQRLQMETMALYKQHGANPLTGCLPLVLQMPIWLGLYRMLSSTGELYNQAFIPGWIDDLTNSDPFHILPVVLMVTMFFQARLTPMGPATDPTQKMQQRMMQYGMPIMFGVMSFFFPAGLTLYIFTNTILSALHSIYMNKFDKKSIALANKIKAAQEEAAAAKTTSAVTKAKNANVTADADSNDEDDDAGTSSASKPTVRPGGGASRAKRKKRRR
jgi:YidC/Oxa1 family membrane protein insertase